MDINQYNVIHRVISLVGLFFYFVLLFFFSLPLMALEYDEVSDQVMSYDTDCDALRGCYQVFSSQDLVSKISSLSYVIGQDDDGKSIEIYSESYIDGSLSSKQETDYSLSQELLENRTYAGNDPHIIAIKDYHYDVYNRKAEEVVKSFDNSGVLYQTNYLNHHYDGFNLDKEIQTELTSTDPGNYKSYAINYDVLGRSISRSYQLSGQEYQTTNQYDGADRGVLGRDFNANTSASIYDSNGHLSQMVSYNNSSDLSHHLQASNDTQVIDYQYDNYSRLIEHSLNGNSLGYDFNNIGLETEFSIVNDVSQGGNLRGSSNSEDIEYDEYNRISNYSDYNNMTYFINYKPDSEVRQVQMRSSTSNISGVLSSDKYNYDDSVPYWLKGRIHTQTINVDQNGHKQVNLVTKEYYSPEEVSYTTNIGKLKSVRYQVSQDTRSVEDLTITYYYDDQERIISEKYLSKSNPTETEGDHTENNLNKITDYTYDPLNRLIKSDTVFTSQNKQDGDLVEQVEEYTYNINGDITRHVTVKTGQGGVGQVVTNDYTYNEIDQLTERVETTQDMGSTT